MWIVYLLRVALHALLDTWLSGSLLLPFMLLIRWGGSKWSGLGWLTRTKKRWLLVWGCYGLAKVIAVAGFVLVRDYHRNFIDFEVLGWEGGVVWNVIRALHIQRGEILIVFLVGFALVAIVDVAVHCGLAAVTWRIFSLLARRTETRLRIMAIERYGLSLLLSACALGVANNLNFRRATYCNDCLISYGTPFTLLKEGGFVGVRIYVWSGLIADTLIMVGIGLVIGLLWNTLALRESKQRYS